MFQRNTNYALQNGHILDTVAQKLRKFFHFASFQNSAYWISLPLSALSVSILLAIEAIYWGHCDLIAFYYNYLLFYHLLGDVLLTAVGYVDPFPRYSVVTL